MFKVEYYVVFNRGLRDERAAYAEAIFDGPSAMIDAQAFAKSCGRDCLDCYETYSESD